MYKFFKRLLDIIVSLININYFITSFYSHYIILRLSAEGEVFYFQERYGIIIQDSKYGSLQQCLKIL